MEFKYNRRTHLIGLILALIVYIVMVVVTIIAGYGLVVGGWLVGLIIFGVLWFLRTLPQLLKFFPLFHYISLVVEFVSHLLSLLYSIYWAITALIALLNSFNLWWMIWVVCLVLLLLVYLLLTFVLGAVVFVLLKGSAADKAELAKEVCSNEPVQLAAAVSQA